MEPEDYENRIGELEALIEEDQSALDPIMEQISELTNEERAEYEEYKKRIEAIRFKKMKADEERFAHQRRLNEARAELRRLQEQREREQREAERLRREMEMLEKQLAMNAEIRDKFDKLTIGAPWRELAKDHQIDAGKFIAENRYVIEADPMGLGKTLSSIITVEMAQQATKDASPEFPFLGQEKQIYNYELGEHITQIVNGIERPVGNRILYLCPASLVKNVRDEWKRWAPHRNVMFIYKMTKEERNYALSFAHENFNEYVVICNYEAWRRDGALIHKFIEMDFDTVIIDEAHNAKDMRTNVWKGINSILTLEKRPEYIIPMTGTPILNRPQELFTLLNMVNPSEFYHENDFLWTYCEQFQTEEGTVLWKFKEGGLDRIAKRIRKNFIRRTKDQAGIILPEKTIIHHDLEVDKETYSAQAKAREEMRKYATIMIDENKGKALAAAAKIAVITRLRQIETWPAGIIQYAKDPMGKFIMNPDGTKQIALQLEVEESQKIDYIIRKSENGEWDGLIPEAIEDERMVLFSQFKAPLKEIERRINASGKRAVVLDGSTPDSLRDAIRQDFDARFTPERSNAKWDIVLCNYKVGGVGLNFTAATQLIVLDEEWNPGKRDQAYDRIHRIGQEKPVTIHVIRDQGTIDDWMASIMEGKEQTTEGFDAVISSDALRIALENGDI